MKYIVTPSSPKGRRIVAPLVLALLAGCSSSTAPREAAPAQTATVNVDALVRQHPFYPLLRHYDEQISALRATRAGGPIDNAAMANDVARLRSDLTAAAGKLQTIVDTQTRRYQSAEDAAVSQLLRAAPQPNIAADIQRNYRAQRSALQSNAARDMQRYRTELLAEQNAAYAAYVKGVNSRITRAYNAREQQLRERESTLALDLARKDTPRSLSAQLRLETLKLDAQRRHATRSQLRSIGASEDAVVLAQRRRDDAELAGYRSQLLAEAHKDVADAALRMQSRALTNLDARREVYLSQARASQANLAVGARANTDLRIALHRWQDRERARYDAGLRETVTAFTQTGVAERLHSVQQTDADASKNTDAQITQLVQDREALRARLRDQVLQVAKQIASSRHLAIVERGPAVTDLTKAVASRLHDYAV